MVCPNIPHQCAYIVNYVHWVMTHDANFTLKAGTKALGPLYCVAIKLVHLRIPAQPSTI